jgi:uncharacterized membrane protein YeaQ/YmgE (transglycosylase-associated protein family)
MVSASPHRGFVASIVGSSVGALVGGWLGSVLGWYGGVIYRRWAPPPDCESETFAAGIGCGLAWLLLPVLIGSVALGLTGACLGCWIGLRVKGYNRRFATVIILLPTAIAALYAIVAVAIWWSQDEPSFMHFVVLFVMAGGAVPLIARSVALKFPSRIRGRLEP